jgi:S-formylglutathione hydrolase FrmB
VGLRGLAAALVAVCLAGCSAAETERFTIDSRYLGRKLQQTLIVPDGGGKGRPLLVLLHGRGGSDRSLLSDELLDGLDELGERAPVVLLANGGDHSYYHDRADGRWGTYIRHEAIPAALERSGADAERVAIGGVSMGGFGAFELANTRGFCAVGAHSGAFWLTGAQTPKGAFDDADDFRRHDLLGRASARLYVDIPAWIDVGTEDPFRAAGAELARRLRAAGGEVEFHLWPGDHSNAYWKRHMGEYLEFYARRLDRC